MIISYINKSSVDIINRITNSVNSDERHMREDSVSNYLNKYSQIIFIFNKSIKYNDRYVNYYTISKHRCCRVSKEGK